MVEWKELGEVCVFKRGKTITAKQAQAGNIPVVAGGQTPSYYHNEANRTGESITVAGSGAYAGYVSYWNQPIFVSDAFTVEPTKKSFIFKYLYHWLKLNQQRIIATQKGAGVPHVHGKNIAKFKIPIPPIEEQERIVRILDTFTAGIENVKKQLSLRRKQYEYYRNHLLNPASLPNAEYCSIGEVCKTTSPPRKLGTKLYQQKGKYPIIDQGQSHIVGYTDDESALLPENEYVLFGDHTRIVKYYYGQFAQGADGLKILVSNRNIILPHYLFHVIKSTDIPSRGYSRHWSIVKELQIPIPTFSKQKQIVAILNQFETSIANLEQQLTLREKQYEYYRNKLLTF